MKRSEAIKKYSEPIKEAMIESYRSVLNSYGKIQYRIYAWEDGEIERMEQVQGDNAYLQAKDIEPRELFYVCTISMPFYSPWDYSDHAAPEEENEREAEEREIIDYMVDEYQQNISDVIDDIITEAERDESLGY